MKNITDNIKWARYVVIGLIFSLPVLLPFIVSSHLLFPFITGKNFFFRLVAELAFGSWIILALYNPHYRPRFSPLVWAFGIFVIIIGLADFFGVDSYKSFWSNNERMEGFITILHLFILFIALAHIFTEKMWIRLIQTSLIISVIVGVQGAVELFQGDTRINGSFGNTTYLGVYSLIHVFFALFFLVRELYSVSESQKLRLQHSLAYGAIVIVNVFVLYFTGTRGSLLGLAAGLSLTSIIYLITDWKRKVLRYASITILSLELLFMVFLSSIYGTEFAKRNSLLDRFSSIAYKTITFDFSGLANVEGNTRIAIWGMALEGVKERPILGWGQENFTYVFSKYYDPQIFDQEQWFDRTHNVFFDWLVAGGILGLLSYLAIFACLLWVLWRSGHTFNSVERGIITGLILAYFVHNFFVFDNLVSYVLIVLVISFVHLKSKKHASEVEVHHSKTDLGIWPAVVVGIVTIMSPYIINGDAYRGSYTLLTALAESKTAFTVGATDKRGEAYLSQSLSSFNRAISFRSMNDTEAREQLIDNANRVYQSNFSQEIKLAFASTTVSEYEKEIARRPDDARGHILFGAFLFQIGDYKYAESEIERARELSPRKQTILFALAQIYAVQGKTAESLTVYKEAYELAPQFDEPKLRYALALAVSGKKVESNKLLSEIPDNLLIDQRFIGVYLDMKRFDLLVKIFEKIVQTDPDPQHKISLAVAYLENGQRAKSIEMLELVAKQVPSLATKMQSLISEIRAGRNPIGK